MTDEQIIKALECCSYATSNKDCEKCPYYPDEECVKKQCTDILNLINRQKAEIERKTNLISETVDEYAKFKEAAKRQETARVRNIEQVADEEIKRLKAEIERLNKEVDRLSQCVMYHDGQIADAIKEFAERLCEGRVSNDPVVIAVKTELKLMEGKTK